MDIVSGIKQTFGTTDVCEKYFWGPTGNVLVEWEVFAKDAG